MDMMLGVDLMQRSQPGRSTTPDRIFRDYDDTFAQCCHH
jgi:hypothetical protein